MRQGVASFAQMRRADNAKEDCHMGVILVTDFRGLQPLMFDFFYFLITRLLQSLQKFDQGKVLLQTFDALVAQHCWLTVEGTKQDQRTIAWREAAKTRMANGVSTVE